MSHCADTTVKDLGVDQYLRRVGAVNRERQLHVSGCPLWVELQRDATVDAPLRSFEDVLPPRVWVLPGLLSGFRSVTLPPSADPTTPMQAFFVNMLPLLVGQLELFTAGINCVPGTLHSGRAV